MICDSELDLLIKEYGIITDIDEMIKSISAYYTVPVKINHISRRGIDGKKDCASDPGSAVSIKAKVSDNVRDKKNVVSENVTLSKMRSILAKSDTARAVFPKNFDKEQYRKTTDRLTDPMLINDIQNAFRETNPSGKPNRDVEKLQDFRKKAYGIIESDSDDADSNSLSMMFADYIRKADFVKWLESCRKNSQNKSPKACFVALENAILNYLKECGFFVPNTDEDNCLDFFSNGIYPQYTDIAENVGKIKEVIVEPFAFYFYDENCQKDTIVIPGKCIAWADDDKTKG